MEWLLRRFRRGRERLPLVCFLRENGPIAYQSALFARQPRERAEAMLATGLAWYWKTAGRDWTELSRWSLAALLSDLAAADGNPAPPLLAVAVEPDDVPTGISDAAAAAWLRAFNSASTGPLQAVVTRAGADGDLLFVAQQPAEPVRALLHDWGIDRGKAARRAYARLHAHGLEELERSLTRGWHR